MKRLRLRLLVLVDLVLIVAAVAVLLVWTPQPSSAQATFTIHKVDDATFSPQSRTDPFFVLLIGTDNRAGLDGTRGDALHLVGVNPAAASATILNIPRDTYVSIPGMGEGKINDAYKRGGFGKQVETVAAFTGITPSFVVEINFDGFMSMIDEMGGLDINVPYRMFDKNSGADFQPGPVHMSGGAALSYARNRHIPDGDIARTTNQAWLLISGLQRARDVNTSPLETIRLMGMMARYTHYDGVSLRELYNLIGLGTSIDPANVRNVTAPSSIGKVGPADVVFSAPGSQELFADLRDDAMLESH